MNIMRLKKMYFFDKLLTGLGISCAIVPIVIFLLGWTKRYIAIICTAFLLYFGIRLYRNISKDIEQNADVTIMEHLPFWLISLLVIFLWVLFSGIGNFSYQTGDFIARNPMFRDLYQYSWPVYYDFNKQSELVRSIIGDASSGTYVYYFAYWLPAAALVKITHCQWLAQPALFLWTVMVLFLTYYFLVRYIKKYSYWILSTFVLFSGLDIIPYLICNMKLPDATMLEWWAGAGAAIFQYTGNTTQLYWVFNQTLPISLIVSLLLLAKGSKENLALCSLSFAYSPYATIGMIPIAIVSVFNNHSERKHVNLFEDVKRAISLENIIVPIIMLVIFGSFYMQNKSGLTSLNSGIIFKIFPEYRIFTIYVAFCLIEFGIYYLAMGKSAFKYRFYATSLLELLLIPLYYGGTYTGGSNFCMRASLPALMLLMVILLQYIHDNDIALLNERRRKAVFLLLAIGYLNSFSEIQRNVKNTLTMSQNDCINESIYSFGEMRTDSEFWINAVINQYVPTDYQDSFFYKHIAERGYGES